MSYFSLALTEALDSSKLTQTDLAAKTNIAFAQVNRYATGRSDLRPAILLKLLQVFPDDVSAELLRAYLLDQCPPEKRHLVDINSTTGILREAGPDMLRHLPENVRGALYFLGAKCHEPHVLDFVEYFTKLLGYQSESAELSNSPIAMPVVDAETDEILPADQLAEAERLRRSQATRDSQSKKA